MYLQFVATTGSIITRVTLERLVLEMDSFVSNQMRLLYEAATTDLNY